MSQFNNNGWINLRAGNGAAGADGNPTNPGATLSHGEGSTGGSGIVWPHSAGCV